MKRAYGTNITWTLILIVFACTSFAAARQAAQNGAQKSPPNRATTANSASAGSAKPLVLSFAIPLEGVKGRFDHFAFGGGRLFVSELGSNSVAIVSLGGRTLEHTITGVPDPQGEAYSPETNKLFVASGTAAKVYIYDGTSYDLIANVDFPGGADNLRYDAMTKRVYVGCGNNEKNGGSARLTLLLTSVRMKITSWAVNRSLSNWKNPAQTSTSTCRARTRLR